MSCGRRGSGPPCARAWNPRRPHDCLANLAQGTVCKILKRHEVKPRKVRYYLERCDAELEQMAECHREVAIPEEGCCRVEKAEQASGDRLLRREAGYPSDRSISCRISRQLSSGRSCVIL
jgi:hypothetical protein